AVNGAVGAYSLALELAARDADIYANGVNAVLAPGQDQDAIVDYTRATQLDPSLAEAVFNRGGAYAKLGQRDAAQAHWTRAIALESDPGTKSAMQRSAGLGVSPAVVSVVTPDVQPALVPPAPPPGTPPGTVPSALTPAPL